jgi:hypothetical protein
VKTLKVEAVYPMAYDSFADVAENLPRFIEEVYNTRRLHSAIGRPVARTQCLVPAKNREITYLSDAHLTDEC